jgi:arylsulfatase A-like enzyme
MKHAAMLTAAVAATLTFALAACRGGGDEPPTSAPRAPLHVEGGPLRLLHHLDAATITGSLRGLDGRLDADDLGRETWRDDASGPPDAAWFDGRWFAELDESLAAPSHARAQPQPDGTWRLAPEDVGLHRLVAVGAEQPSIVLARVRRLASAAPSAATNAELPRLMALPHRFAPPDDAAQRAALVHSIDAAALAQQRVAELPAAAAASGAWTTLALFLDPVEGQRSLSLSLFPGDAPLEVDWVAVRAAPAVATLGQRPRLSFDLATHPLARAIDLIHAAADTLLLPSGVRVAWPLVVPADRPRLLFRPGALALREGLVAALAIDVDGQRAWSGRATSPPPETGQAPELVVLDLAPWAGRTIELAFSADAGAHADDVVAACFAPELLAPVAAPRPPNLLLISLDTLRADHVGCYGDARGLTPAIDALAAAGTRFAHVQSPSSWTLPTHMSAMTGQHPAVHGALESDRVMDPLRSAPLGARLREAGYATAAFTAGGPVHPRNGFGLGFDFYGVDDPMGVTRLRHDLAVVQSAKARGEVDDLAPAIDWLDRHADLPFCLFVHTFLVHNYDAKPRWLARVPDAGAPLHDDFPLKLGAAAKEGDAAALRRIRTLYAATLAQADELLVKRLLAELDALRIADDTVVCLMADHGEEFLEHGWFGHHKELWSETTRVPWIVRGPGVPRGKVHESAVELGDLAPTIAALLRLPPDPRVMGVDRFGPGGDEEEARLLLLGDVDAPGSREALVVGPWKVMRWIAKEGEEPRVRLFHVGDDPGETLDRAAEDPARLRALLFQLDSRKAALRAAAAELPSSGTRQSRDLTPAEIQRLKDLGYIGE